MNKEQIKNYNHQYWVENKERISLKKKLFRQLYPRIEKEKRKLHDVKYRSTHKLEKKHKDKKYYLKNKTKLGFINKKWRDNHKQDVIEYNKRYFQEHPEGHLKSNINQLNKLGGVLDLSKWEYLRAVQSWSKVVRNRDKVCIICGSIDRLNAHHLLYKKYRPKLSLNINNGVMLCKLHHDEVHHPKGFAEIKTLNKIPLVI